MQGALAEDIGYDGTSMICQQILEGTYITPPGTNEYTSAYLQELKRPEHIHKTPKAAVSTPTFQDG